MTTTIPQKQGSAMWLNWRKSKIGASEASVFFNLSPWQSIGSLWEEKLGLKAPELENAAMSRGKALEEEARLCFEDMTGLTMFPKVVQHPIYSHLIASLDGMDMEGENIVEIKCPGPKDHGLALKGEIPEKYVPQLQHIMAVTGHEKAFYFSYRDGKGIVLKLQRDQKYIDELMSREARFYALLMKGKQLIKEHEEMIDKVKDELYEIVK